MAQGYYTLEQAAQVLGIPVDQLKMLARKQEIRAFQDRGTWRFRAQDIQEMARRRGIGSDPELPLGQAAPPAPGSSPTPRSGAGKSSPGPKKREPEVFNLAEDSSTSVGKEVPGGRPGSSKTGQPRTPPPGSDSDVRLVGEDFSSDVKMVDTPRPASRAGQAGPRSPRPASPPPKSGQSPPPAPDSGVRLVPLESDSDVRIVPQEGQEAVGHQPPPSATDSDIRLEMPKPTQPRASDEMLTEEINLDEELSKQREAPKPPPQAKVRPAGKSRPPASSPFELSEHDIGPPPSSGEVPAVKDPSSDFELTPAGDSSSPLEPGTDEFGLELPDEQVALGEGPAQGELKGPSSGINLDRPLDSGISLEQGGEGSDEIEFNLTLEDEAAPKHKTPRPAGAKAPDSGSEFELTLDPEDAKAAPDSSDSEFELTLGMDEAQAAAAGEPSSSEFELTLDADNAAAGAGTDSDSEFELTLDSSDEHTPAGESSSDSEFDLSLDVDDAEAKPKKKGKKTRHEPDIFDTDFAPDLDAESGSEAVALDEGDTDLESSDFDLAIDDKDVAAEEGEDSGSQVVALDEGEDEEGTPGGRRAAALEEEEPGFQGLAGEEAAEEEAGEPVVHHEVVAARWGALPVAFMLPCVIVMFLVGIMGFELVQSVTGYKQPGLITKAVSGLILPK
jgi:excisionase family DNA binding protein